MARTRFILIVLLAFTPCFVWAQGSGKPAPVQEAEPPEEDASLVEKTYSFNPIQAEQEIKIGNYYAKKGSWKAARGRYLEATKWEPTNPQAWLRLGEVHEKTGDRKAAKAAFDQYLSLAPEAKNAASIRKKIAAW